MKLSTPSQIPFLSLFFLIVLATMTSSCSSTTLIPSSFQTKEKIRPMVDNSKEALLNIPYRSLNTSKDLQTIGFGSCADQNQPQPIWSMIEKNNPELFIMMGDNVYASKKEDKPIVDQYIKLNKVSEFVKLRESIPFLAIWDDHDYGQNDGGFDNPEKEEAKKAFLKYWGYLKPTLPTNQKALYHSRIIGKTKKVQVILLDTRWDRSQLNKNPDFDPLKTDDLLPKIYLPSEDKKSQVLSAEQWQWFESELKKPAHLRLIISSIQLIPNDHYFEKWGNFPLEREKFFNLLKKHKIKNSIILSGDRHLAAISQYNIKGLGQIHEVTSSAINRPSRSKTPEKDSSYISEAFLFTNFGLINIDWKKKIAQVRIIDENNKTQLETNIRF